MNITRYGELKMTSQGIITTKRNCILASDRQSTMPDGKTYGGFEKIFELSKIHSAGLMFNGNADFEDTPLETLIRRFKIKTNFNKLSTIEEIKNGFIKFLSKNTEYSSSQEFINGVLKNFKKELKHEFDENGFEKTITLKQKRKLPRFIKSFPNINNEFQDILPDGKNTKENNYILWEIFSHYIQYEGTGIIIAGFNLKSNYPSFVEINIYCNDNGKIIHEKIDSAVDCKEPFIKVFAINEEAYTFITGVSNEFIEYILSYIEAANESILTHLKWNLEKEKIENCDRILENIKNLQSEEYLDLTEDIDNYRLDAIEDTSYSIDNLPEWLLCIFAELLIRLTAVKQKTSSDIESVSIDTDILILSKTNSFKWIKNHERIV